MWNRYISNPLQLPLTRGRDKSDPNWQAQKWRTSESPGRWTPRESTLAHYRQEPLHLPMHLPTRLTLGGYQTNHSSFRVKLKSVVSKSQTYFLSLLATLVNTMKNWQQEHNAFFLHILTRFDNNNRYNNKQGHQAFPPCDPPTVSKVVKWFLLIAIESEPSSWFDYKDRFHLAIQWRQATCNPYSLVRQCQWHQVQVSSFLHLFSSNTTSSSASV